MLKTSGATIDLRVEYLCENGSLVYNAVACGVGYCNRSFNKLEKKKKPRDWTVVGLSQGLRPIGLNLLAFMDNDNRIIRVGQGLSPLLSYILAPSPRTGGACGIYFDSRLSRTKYAQLAICSCRPACVGRYEQAAECCLVVAYICVGDKKKGRMRQHPALFIFLIVSKRSDTEVRQHILYGPYRGRGCCTPICLSKA